jgi:transcription elongation GreA/GreB family factor
MSKQLLGKRVDDEISVLLPNEKQKINFYILSIRYK